MNEAITLLVLFVLGCGSGFINVMAGGGSTLTVPMLIFLGLPGPMANGTNRIALLVQNIAAIVAFKRENYQEFRRSLLLSAFTLPGAVLGALYANRIDSRLWETILAFVLIGVILTIMVPSRRGRGSANRASSSAMARWLVYPAMLGVGFYGGFIQIGVGFLIMASLRHLLGLDLIRVNMHKVFIVFIYTIPVMVIFAWHGNINWKYGAILACGNALGAWWSAKVTVRKGDKAIRAVLAVAVLIMAARLLGMF